jgi:hypothetical protein
MVTAAITSHKEESKMASTTHTNELLELDARSADGISVRLLWRRGRTEVLVEVVDSRGGDGLLFDVPLERALDAFRHPFAYAPLSSAPASGLFSSHDLDRHGEEVSR